MRYILPLILIATSVGLFFAFINPTYQEVKALRGESARYDAALTNSQQLQSERDALSEKYRNMPAEQIARLEKLLPDNADNIRLIINLQQMAQTYGMAISSIKFDANAVDTSANSLAAVSVQEQQKDYGTFKLEFTTNGSYDSFQKFLKDMERSLRVTDIESIDFNSEGGNANKQSYLYTIKLRTYWLKS